MGAYSDDQLATAIADSHSWRGVLRALGLLASSGSAMRSARKHADKLGLDYRHFRGQRRWTDAELGLAIAQATTWQQVCDMLDLAGGSSTAHLRGHAVRLGLDFSHFNSEPREPPRAIADLRPQLPHLPRAGSLLAAAWFELTGCSVSWPLEPCRYDLLVWLDGSVQRIQVKTTRFRSGSSWVAQLATNRKEVHTYDPDEIDYFFIIDGDFGYYLIPVHVVGGLTNIQLSAYGAFRLNASCASPGLAPRCRSAYR